MRMVWKQLVFQYGVISNDCVSEQTHCSTFGRVDLT